MIATCRLVVGALILVIGLRTWVVLGLFAPIYVSGSSMAPSLRGPYVVAHCTVCGQSSEVAAEQALDASVPCTRCREGVLPLAELPRQPADRIWIDRTAFNWRVPRRWEVAVWRAPHDARQLCAKRVVGLPGEIVEIRAGDVWIDGRIAAKPLAAQQALRFPLAQHGQLLTDAWPYNAKVSRQLNYVRDFSLSVEVQIPATGAVILEIYTGRLTHRLTLGATADVGKRLTLEENGTLLRTLPLPAEFSQRLATPGVVVDFSNADQQLLLALDGIAVLQVPYCSPGPPIGTRRACRVSTRGLQTTAQRLQVYRDVYYLAADNQAAGRSPGAAEGYYLLGDNAPISRDSRHWGPVAAKFLVGKVLAWRYPSSSPTGSFEVDRNPRPCAK